MTALEPAPRDHRRRSEVATRSLGAAVLVLVVVLAAASGDEDLWSAPDGTTSDTVEQDAPVDPVVVTPSQTDDSGRLLPDAGPVIELLAVLLFVGVVVLAAVIVVRGVGGSAWGSLFGRRRRPRTVPAAALPHEPRTVEADDAEAFAALREGSPRNAIVRCWMVLERNAASAGVPRRPAETSSEYVERVVGASSIDHRPIAELGALFREARFSSRPIDEARRAQAESALRRTLASLGGRAEQRT